ncbi:hypothetical protein Tco_0680065 [Tanacetum coccineum]|uniref:Uncharacterized protein n=1 Tax=Tanacetum coccineum TaxID=301880 RepID=A0ABQ4XKD4_9ASTR
MKEDQYAVLKIKVFNWETAKYGKIWYDEDIHDLRSVETEFSAIAFIDEVSSKKTLSCEHTVSSLNDNKINVRISFDESDDEDYTPSRSVILMIRLLYNFEKEFPSHYYNDDAQTSKSDLLTEPILNPQHIDEFNLKDETSLSECDEEEQNVLNFNDLFPFNVIYPNDSKSDKDNDDDKVDIEHSSGDLSVKPLPDVIVNGDAPTIASASAGTEENTSSTNEAINTAYDVTTASSQGQASSSTYVDDVMFSFFANQSNSPQLDNEDLEQIDIDDLEKMDLKWRGHFPREYMALRNQGNRNGDNTRRVVPVETPANALVVQDGIGGYDWSFQAEEGITNFALMAYTSQGYQMGLESLEARIVVHEKNEVVYEENIAFLKYDVQSNKDKAGLGYDSQMNKSEVVHSVFNSRESNVDDSLVNDRFKTGEGFHAILPPYTGNYMPSRPDLSFDGLDDFVYKTKVSETETSISKTSKDIVEKPKTVRPSALIIEDWDTDSDNDSVFRPKSDQTKPKFTKINFVKSDENVKSVNKENTHRQVEYPRKSQSPRDNRRNWNGLMTQKLGNGFEFIKKACFVCGSFNHLIKDCDFHEKKMVEKPMLNNKGRVIGQKEIRPVWNNAQRVNHQNKLTRQHPKRNFIPTAVATKSGQVSVNAAKQSSPRAAASISTARHVNTAAPKPKVNDALPTTYSYLKHINQVNNVTTAGPKAVVNAAKGNGENVVKSSACWIWIPTGNVIDHTSKDSRSYMLKRFDYVDLQGRLKSIIKRLLEKGFVAFGGSPKGGKITGKGEANYVNMQSRMDGRTCNIKQKCVKSQTPRQAKRVRDTKIPHSGGPPEKVGDEAVHKELSDRMEMAATTASSLEAKQDSGNINRTQSMETLNEPSP